MRSQQSELGKRNKKRKNPLCSFELTSDITLSSFWLFQAVWQQQHLRKRDLQHFVPRTRLASFIHSFIHSFDVRLDPTYTGQSTLSASKANLSKYSGSSPRWCRLEWLYTWQQFPQPLWRCLHTILRRDRITHTLFLTVRTYFTLQAVLLPWCGSHLQECQNKSSIATFQTQWMRWYEIDPSNMGKSSWNQGSLPYANILPLGYGIWASRKFMIHVSDTRCSHLLSHMDYEMHLSSIVHSIHYTSISLASDTNNAVYKSNLREMITDTQ